MPPRAPEARFRQLSVGYGTVCGIELDNTVMCWGYRAIRESSGNTAPVAIAGAPYAGSEGAPVDFDAGASSDPDHDVLAFAWDFGDGASGAGASATHAYADDGTYTVRLIVTDPGGLSDTAMTTATIANVPPTAAFTNGGPVDEGRPFALRLLDAHDASPTDRAAGFRYAFDCGDGAGFRDAGASAEISCPTTDDALREVRARITDKDGGATDYAAQVAVRNVAPAVNPSSGS